MTDSDEHLLAMAKLRERLRGDLEHGDLPHRHAGLVEDADHRSTLSFVADVLADRGESIEDTDLGSTVLDAFTTETASEAVFQNRSALAAHLTGITEMDLDGSALRLPMRLNDQLDNHGATAFIIGAGNPNTGKTNTMSLLVELRDYLLDDLLVLSNVRSWERTDHVVTSAHDLAVTLLEHRDVPKFVVLDEASTHLDSRTNRREVATQWTPLAKRFSKINVDACGVICHTGKDLHPEAKRLATLCYYKTQPDVAEFYERWPADADFPADRLFGGDIDDLEPTGMAYDPDDAAPWEWDLEPDLFAEDLKWSELLESLKSRGSI